MELWTGIEFRTLVLAVTIWDMARADHNDWEQRFQFSYDPNSSNRWKPQTETPLHTFNPPVPRWFLAGIVFMVAFFVGMVIATCYCHFRRRRMLRAMVPPPLAPVTSGAEMYGYSDQQPPVPGAVSSPGVPYPPQQGGYQRQATPYTQVPLYAGQSVASLQQPSAPPPLVLPEVPPPYGFQSNHLH